MSRTKIKNMFRFDLDFLLQNLNFQKEWVYSKFMFYFKKFEFHRFTILM